MGGRLNPWTQTLESRSGSCSPCEYFGHRSGFGVVSSVGGPPGTPSVGGRPTDPPGGSHIPLQSPGRWDKKTPKIRPRSGSVSAGLDRSESEGPLRQSSQQETLNQPETSQKESFSRYLTKRNETVRRSSCGGRRVRVRSLDTPSSVPSV